MFQFKLIKQKIFNMFKFSFGVGYLMFNDVLIRFGLFALGCCPGGLHSNYWCHMLGGDVNLSVTMTTISTISALGKEKLNVIMFI